MIATLTSAASKAFRKIGYTIIPTWRLAHFPFGEHLRRILQTFEIDCVLDVGANTGQYRDFLRDQVGYEGTIVSFEPIPDLVEILRSRASQDRKWFIEGCALGAASGQATFNVMVNTQFSSFLDPDHSMAESLYGQNEVAQTIAVEVKTIDGVIPALKDRLGIKRPYLKLDTQGFDLEVLRGTREQLKTIPALQTEISIKTIYHNMPNYFEAITALESLGFGISGIFPIHPELQFPEAIEFDCIMVNKALVSRPEKAA